MFWLILLFISPLPAAAHVQWFVTAPAVAMPPFQPWEIAVGTCGGLVLLTTLWALTRLDTTLWKTIRLKPYLQEWIPIIALLIGCISAIFAYHRELMLVYLGLIAYALAWKRSPRLALTLLAAGTGLAFTYAAFVEKILHPEYSATFLQNHHWNFLANLGWTTFSDRWFILSAGVVEAGLGLALAIGLAPRITITLLTLVCVTTAILLGITEVYGHIIIVMAFMIYLVGTLRTPPWSILDLHRK